MTNENSLDLISLPADYGHGANDGAYYPVGLLTIASHLRRVCPSRLVRVVDMHHKNDYFPSADVVGISASSTLCYKNVLSIAEKAKASGSTVILGGPHATHLADQILHNRGGIVDYVIRNDGEKPLAELLNALEMDADISRVFNLSYRNSRGKIVHNPTHGQIWSYEDYLPLDFSVLAVGLEPYWQKLREVVQKDAKAGFVVFTHFGCGYQHKMKYLSSSVDRLSRSCSYCSLGGEVISRKAECIIDEILRLIHAYHIPNGSKVLLKCYGDNIGYHSNLIDALTLAIEREPQWHLFDIEWTFYMQSSLLTEQLADNLVRIGAKRLFIGFDSVDDRVQRLNGLGTSLATHQRAVRICSDREIRVHGGFVLGCAGETISSIEKAMRFAEEIAATGILERINAAVMVIMPGAPAYDLLCQKEPWIRKMDLLDTEEMRWHWLRHFCPQLGRSPSHAQQILHDAANKLDDLSIGAHASMGFVSRRLQEQFSRKVS